MFCWTCEKLWALFQKEKEKKKDEKKREKEPEKPAKPLTTEKVTFLFKTQSKITILLYAILKAFWIFMKFQT